MTFKIILIKVKRFNNPTIIIDWKFAKSLH